MTRGHQTVAQAREQELIGAVRAAVWASDDDLRRKFGAAGAAPDREMIADALAGLGLKEAPA